MDKLHGDVTIPLLRSWRNRWNDFVELNQLAMYSGSEQMAAMALNPAMQQVVEMTLGILPTTMTTSDAVLDRIADYIRAKRNITLDRVAFEGRRHQIRLMISTLDYGDWQMQRIYARLVLIRDLSHASSRAVFGRSIENKN